MTTCYACEFKEYKKGNQIPNENCPSDCTILLLLRGLGVSVRGVQALALSMGQHFAAVDDFLVDLEETEREGGLVETVQQAAYKKIYSWHKKNSGLIQKIHGKSDDYSDAYLKLVESLPEPRMVTDEDMLFIARQIKTMLMEWSYNQEDEDGKKMHEYASIIEQALGNTGIDIKSSKLNDILTEYQRRRGY